MGKHVDPQNPQEWQEAADGAALGLLVHSAKCYGLVAGGPKVNVARCQELLDRAAAQGITPAPAGELVARAFRAPPA